MIRWAVKTSLTKNSFTKSLLLSMVVVILISSLSACKAKKTDAESEVSSVGTTSSNTVSIYYKDDASSNEGYNDIITDKSESKDQSSGSDNLAEDADPQLIIPSDKNKTESKIDGVSSKDVSHKDEESSVTSTENTSSKTDFSDNKSDEKETNSKQNGSEESNSKNPVSSESKTDSQTSETQDNTDDNNTSSGSSNSGDNSSSTESNDNVNGDSSEDSSASSTTSYDKGYTKPY